MKQIKPRATSLNWLGNLSSLVLLALEVLLGERIEIDPQMTIEAFSERNFVYIAQILLPMIIATTLKIQTKIKEGTFQISKLWKSSNFVTAFIGFLSLLLGSIGIMFDGAMPQAITDAIFTGTTISLISAVISYIINPVYHFIKDKQGKEETPK